MHSFFQSSGCGPLKYNPEGCFTIGFDTCSDALLASQCHGAYRDVVLANALHLPFKKSCANAVLCVSLLHHISSNGRRLRVLKNLSRVMCSFSSKMMIYVWAKEQPNAMFPSQDVLVPWNLHELSKGNGLLPLVSFHKYSTREQRIISNSIAIDVDDENDRSTVLFISHWFERWLSRFQRKLFALERQVPPAIPQLFREKKVEGVTRILSGINHWSPMLGSRLRSALQSVEELYASELTLTLLEEAMAIALSTLREVIYYRYYHVFREGELKELVEKTDGLIVRELSYDSANWSLVAEKHKRI